MPTLLSGRTFKPPSTQQQLELGYREAPSVHEPMTILFSKASPLPPDGPQTVRNLSSWIAGSPRKNGAGACNHGGNAIAAFFVAGWPGFLS